MLISELIEELKDIKELRGDIQVVLHSTKGGYARNINVNIQYIMDKIQPIPMTGEKLLTGNNYAVIHESKDCIE